ncbi:hypothetical protein KR215_007568 [Drosophila sulfurigaster]|nr:hypothetical protein KR215_007568 [Drosophila sulfurigaster]
MSSAESNYTGIRSVFQWTIGDISSIEGIHNALDFSVSDTDTLQTLNGHIGIYSIDSQTGIHLSFDAVDSSSPGPNFICSDTFTLINGKQTCYNLNYILTSNAIYYLDVEINNKTLRGYISEPQRNRTTIDDTTVERSLIGEMNWRNELKDLRPLSYWCALSYGYSCKNLSDISTFNYAPVSYTNSSRTLTSFASSTITTTTTCGPQNVIALTSWSKDAAIYISRPPAQIDES